MIESHFHHTKSVGQRDYTAGDDFYEALIDAHRDLSPEQSADLNARLILLLANHIGNVDILREALHLAKGSA
ncbi:DUF2783 domain-containing protein [Undibacterium sp. SXout7W]|uniref:DUF2783 domain-containing protein n=1 Tax=Undibacterium sp. SXout7W TaxID=3413049 RepID=UPI003BF304E8